MDIATLFKVFIVVGALLVIAALVVFGFMLYRYIVDMRAQSFFGGKKKDEKE